MRLIADSSCDLHTMPGVDFRSVPMTISTATRHYRDDESLDLHAMLQDLASTHGRTFTACPSIGEWLSAFEGADEIFVCTITSGLSGTYSSALAAKDIYLQSNPDARIHVIDSLSTGPGMRVLLEELAALISKGISFDEIIQKLDDYKQHTRLFFALQSLHNMAQNGRVNPLVAKAIGIMNIRIVATASPEGTVAPIAKSRGDKKALAELVSQIEKAGYKGGRLRISHVQNPTLANQLALAIRDQFPGADILTSPATGLCSYYAEQNGLLIGLDTL